MLLLLLQLAAAPDTATYSTPALAAFVAEAAAANRRVPAALRGYEAAVESEIAIVSPRPGGAEATVGVEQMASRLQWRRTGAYEQRVVGYRAQLVGPSVSVLSWLDQGWMIPSLYGNRMALFFGRDSARGDAGRDSTRLRDGTRRQDRRREPVEAVHPFAEDRAAVYHFGGGDTVATLRVAGRAIPIVRVTVRPRAALPARTFVFQGEVDVDAARHHIVRMRGRFLVTGGRAGLRERLLRRALHALAFVELENQEVAGRYWLPAYQRVELQAGLGPFASTRAVVRIVSRVRDVVPEEEPALAAAPAASARDTMSGAPAPPAAGDTIVASVHRLTVAPRDSLERYDDWRREIGAEAAATHADDFADVAPDALRATGGPVVEPWAERASDVFRFDRVEGAFTGVGVRVRARDLLPGAALGATGGWAWAERRARGRVVGELARGRWTVTAGAGRTLDLTNDFPTLFDSGSTVAALLGRDDYDYVDRRWASLGVAREQGTRWRAALRLGVANDEAVATHVTRGLVRPEEPFRPNRGVREGGYLRTQLRLELSPGVRAELLRPGIGGTLRWERGDGGLEYDRMELRVEARGSRGPWTGALRAEGGLVRGSPLPPQQLFELGGGERLSGFEYKEFAGDRAAVFGGLGMYALPVWRAPLRVRVPFVRRPLYLPSPAPQLSLGLDGGWTGVSGAAALAAVRELGGRRDEETGELVPLSRPSGRVRVSVEARVRLFGGALSAGAARALEGGAGWRLVVGVGQ